MLDNIIKFSIKNKLIIIIMTLFLIAWGLWSGSKLPIDAQPDITNNQVQVITQNPSFAGQEMEQLITFPIEQAVVNVPGIEEIRSISRFGLSVITIVFKENIDIYFARQLVSEKLNQVQDQMPEGSNKPEMAPLSTGLGEVYQYILHPKKGSESKYSASDLRTMQEWIVARQLNGTPGVAEVNSFGGRVKQYEVAVNPGRLKAMGVSISEILTALENNNENTGGAYIEKNPNAYFIRGLGLISSLEDIGNIAIRKNINGDVPLYIRDVAEVKFGSAVRYGALTYNGQVDAVGGIVMMLKGENANEVVGRVKEKMASIKKTLPEDVVIEPFLDRTDLVGRAIKTVRNNLIEGALIVIFILVLFLGNLRAGLIVASAIPLSMLFALGMMNVFGVSANLMSLGAIDFGLIVDGSVIVVEATMHHLGLRKSTKRLTQAEMDDEVFESASKIRSSAAFGEIIILIVYIPILTLVGIEGKMFSPMAKTVGFAILGALILSFTYIPMMSALFLSKKGAHKENFSDKMMAKIYRIYRPLLDACIRFKYWFVGIAVSIFAISILFFSKIGGEFLPTLGEGDFAYHCILPQGTSLSQSIETSMLASRIIKEFDEVKMVVGKTGTAEVPTDPMPPEATDLMVILKPQSEWKSARSYDELAEAINEKLKLIPGVYFEKNQPIQMRFNELMTGVRQDVAIKIFGENMDSLAHFAENVSQLITEVDGATSPQVERVSGLPEINVEYNRTLIANYGLTIEEVNNILSTAFAGKTTGEVYENERRFDLVVRLDSSDRRDISDVDNLLVPLPSGGQIPLSQLAEIRYGLGPAQISRENGKRRIVIGFNVYQRDVASVVKDIQVKIEQKLRLPSGYYVNYGGQFENLEKATDRLLLAVPVSLLLIFILLYFTFSSMKEAILVFTAIPMSAIGGIWALLARGMPFSISAGVGFIALFGVAVLNGIVLIATFNRFEKEGMSDIYQRIIEGTKTRLRPVLMTAAVASLGFLPMALSTGAGAEVQKPLATVVIGGLISATILTLFLLPIFYLIAFNFRPKAKFTALLIFGLSILGSSTQAQSVSLSQAVDWGLSNNKAIQAKEMEVQSVAALKNTAYEMPKTGIDIMFGHNEGFEYNDGITISQSIPFPKSFSAKKNLVEAQAQSSLLQKELSLNELKQQIRLSYNRIQFLNASNAQYLKLDSLYREFGKMAALRFKAGDTKKTDVLVAENKSAELKMLLDQNETKILSELKVLNFLVGNGEIRKESSAPYEIWKLDAGQQTIESHPMLKLTLQEAEIAGLSQVTERASSLPDLNFSYTNASLIGPHEKNGVEKNYGRGQRFGYINFGVNIAIFNKAKRSRIQSLDFAKKALVTKAEYQSEQLNNELSNSYLQYNQSVKNYEFYKRQAEEYAGQILNSAQTGYRSGETSYIEYLFALENATNTHLKLQEAIYELNQTIIKIWNLTNY